MKSMTLVIRAAIVLLFISWSSQAVAQALPNYDQQMLYTSKYYKYKKMKATGLVMTVAGGLLGIVGISKMSNATSTTNSYGQTTYDSDGSAGALMFVAAMPLVGAGIPLAIVGNVKSKKYGALMEAASLSGNMTPHHRGLTLTIKF